MKYRQASNELCLYYSISLLSLLIFLFLLIRQVERRSVKVVWTVCIDLYFSSLFVTYEKECTTDTTTSTGSKGGMEKFKGRTRSTVGKRHIDVSLWWWRVYGHEFASHEWLSKERKKSFIYLIGALRRTLESSLTHSVRTGKRLLDHSTVLAR